MIYPAYLIILFSFIQLINVLLNFFFRQKIVNSKSDSDINLSVLIPARNEEKNIGEILQNLIALKIENSEILVYNDESSDDTEIIVSEYAVKNSYVKLINGKELPKGWKGKNYACNILAEKASGEFYLFVDADVRLSDGIIEDSLAYMKSRNLGLLSFFPVQIQKSFGEKISVPIMNYILLTLLPLIFVRISPFKSHSAANGQFMLFDAEIYNKIKPHKKFKNSNAEDIEIARYYKKQKIKIACITGEKRIKCRMYENYTEALNGFSKNIFMFFGNHVSLALLFWLIVSFGFVPVLLNGGVLIYIYLFAVLLIQIFYSTLSHQNVLINIFLFPLQLFFMLHAMSTHIIGKQRGEYYWKGRNLYN
jgi:glycosyltransferase involved in cell wall biosynthesis